MKGGIFLKGILIGFFWLTLIHCLGGNRSHSTQEDVCFVDEVLVDVDRGQTCLALANLTDVFSQIFQS